MNGKMALSKIISIAGFLNILFGGYWIFFALFKSPALEIYQCSHSTFNFVDGSSG